MISKMFGPRGVIHFFSPTKSFAAPFWTKMVAGLELRVYGLQLVFGIKSLRVTSLSSGLDFGYQVFWVWQFKGGPEGPFRS